jgi:hypothetical protein
MHIIGAGSRLTIVFLRIKLSFREALERIPKPAASKSDDWQRVFVLRREPSWLQIQIDWGCRRRSRGLLSTAPFR